MAADQTISLMVNGERRQISAPADKTLLDVLRDDLDLTGAKLACDDGECGSCFVLLGDRPVMSCKLAASRATDKEIVTIEGLAGEGLAGQDKGGQAKGVLHPLQEAFLEAGATQCGFCIPGMIMRAEALLRNKPEPSQDEIVKSLSRNLCRCTGYLKIFEAVAYAAELKKGRARSNWADKSKARGIGATVRRKDTPGTVDGTAKYAADLKMAGMLFGQVLRSPHHHARILSIDSAAAAALPGVEAVVTAADIPGSATMSNCQPQTYLFPSDRTRFLGEGIAAVAAVSPEIAKAALAKIEVVYEPLPAVLGIEEALREEACSLFDAAPNFSPATELHDGDIDGGFAEADVVVEDTFTTSRREHAAMEPEAALAYVDENGILVIKSPLYHPFLQGQQSIAATLDLPVEKVRIVCPAMGGNFGKRGDALAPTVAGLLSLKTGKPVSVVFGRAESILGSSKTPSTRMTYKIGARKDGRIVALQATVHRNMGGWAPYLSAQTTKGTELCAYESIASTMSHITGPYEIANVHATLVDVITNGPRTVPLRGTSGNYLPFAIESLIDRLARELDMDPIELRLRNVLDIGSRTHLGQVMRDSVGIKAELEALREPWAAVRNGAKGNGATPTDEPWKRGVGVACGWRNITYVSMPDISAGAELMADGKIEVLAGSVEQGQGCTSQFAQIASEAMNLPMDLVVVTIGDTLRAPYPVPTFSSITTLVTGKAVLNAVEALREAMVEVAAELLATPPGDIEVLDGFAISKGAPGRMVAFAEIGRQFDSRGLARRREGTFVYEGRATDNSLAGAARSGPMKATDGDEAPDMVYGFNAAIAELEVNEKTGQVRLLQLVNAADPGTIISPQAVQGQIDGGLSFGIGTALSEAFHPDNPPTLRHYGLPTTRDIAPTVTSINIETPSPRGPFGAKSVAEMCVIAPVPAIVNAIADATGKRLHAIPATADRIQAALKEPA